MLVANWTLRRLSGYEKSSLMGNFVFFWETTRSQGKHLDWSSNREGVWERERERETETQRERRRCSASKTRITPDSPTGTPYGNGPKEEQWTGHSEINPPAKPIKYSWLFCVLEIHICCKNMSCRLINVIFARQNWHRNILTLCTTWRSHCNFCKHNDAEIQQRAKENFEIASIEPDTMDCWELGWM